MDDTEYAMLQAINGALDVVPEPYRTTARQHLSSDCHWETYDNGTWCDTHDVKVLPEAVQGQVDPKVARQATRTLQRKMREALKGQREQGGD